MKKLFFVLAFTFIAVACASPSSNINQTATGGDMAVGIVRDYTTWTPMFETVQAFSSQLMLLCRLMTGDEQAYLESEHANHYVQVYANPLAESTMRLEGKRKFPEGSVVVKEKLDQDPRNAGANVQVKPTGLGIMIKREPGYDAAGGDWEYLYVDGAGTITRDQKQLEHCRACHMEKRDADAINYPTWFLQ